MNAPKIVPILALSLAALGACKDLVVPNLNNPSVEDLTENPTVASVAAMTQALMRTTRGNAAGMVQWLGAFGREGYPMSRTGASLTGSVRDPLAGGNFPGNGLWTAPYRNVRHANLILASLGQVSGLTEAEEEGIRGFTKTIQAYDFLNIILTRDRFGAPIEVDRDPTDADPAPFASKEAVYAHVVQLLDDGRTHLQGAGTSFVFSLHEGLDAFDTPASFIELNRALRARVAVYMNEWSVALTALQASFLDTSLSLDVGAYHVFTTNAGDQVNPLNRPDFLYAHPRLMSEAQLKADGTPDLRAQEKLVSVSPLTVIGITSDVQFTMYDDPSAPLPWITNEELILLRAEANLGLGEKASAADDINLIRQRAGDLEPLPDLASRSSEEILDELLYNKRYSLVWEYGHTWIDLRHYGRLDEIPVTPADPLIVDAMPIPINECLARSPQPAGCGELVGG
jgi:hypothetical protein